MGPLVRRLLPALGLAAGLTALQALADQSDDLTRLREEAAQQRRELEGTEARLRALEQKGGETAGRESGSQPAAAPPTQVSQLVQLKQNWSQVEPGTPEDRVRALLGAPEKVLRIDGALMWYYAYPGIGPGSVFFNASGKVSSRQSPRLGW
jgi:uncharacterized coiled-coil protein SlyX